MKEIKAEEVWEVDCGTDDGDENYRPVVWVNDPENGGLRAYFFDDLHDPLYADIAIAGADWPMRYVAESIEVFYARKLWDEYNPSWPDCVMVGTVYAACKFEESKDE